MEGSLLLEVKAKVEAELRDGRTGLKPEEAAVLSLLQVRLSLTLKASWLRAQPGLGEMPIQPGCS